MTTLLTDPNWTVDGWTANAVDDNGVMWVCDADSGWFSPVGIRSGDSDIPNYDGTYSSQDRLTNRVITLAGYGKAPTGALADAACDQFAALLRGGVLKTLSVTKAGVIRTATVKRGSGSDLSRTSPRGFEWQLVLNAPDPRKYGPATTVPASLPSTTGGLDYVTTGGLDYVTAGGLNYGTIGSSGLVTLTNVGTAESWPQFTVNGPTDGATLSNPSIVNTQTGDQITYSGMLATGDILVVDTSPYRASVTLNGQPYRRNLSSAAWFAIDPGDSVSVQFQGTSTSSTPVLQATLAPAYL
jgi:hypothetical protein